MMQPGQNRLHPTAVQSMNQGTGGMHNPMPKPKLPSVGPSITGQPSRPAAAAPAAAAPQPASGWGGSATPQKDVGFNPSSTVNQRAPEPVTGYMKVYQKKADGTWGVTTMLRSKMTAAQIAAALKNGLNGAVSGAAPAGGGSAAPTPSGPAPAAPVASAAPSWIPPRIGLGGLNANPATGLIDWSQLLSQANGVAAVDPQYAQDLSNNIFAAMQSVAPLSAEVESLTKVDPDTGKTYYQRLFDAQSKKYGQNLSSTYGSAAARNIGSSGALNSGLANQTVENDAANKQLDSQYGNTRITDLLKQMTQSLSAQDTNFANSYYGALSRAYGGIPQIGA